MPRTSRLRSYRRLFAPAGTLAFTLGNLLARLPMGMFTVSAVIMIAGVRGSYALAGAVTACGLACTALVAPMTARLVDRYGQARIALPATTVAVLGSVSLILCVRYGAQDWTLFASYAVTATTPNTGGMSRARWAYLFPDDPDARHTANSLEQALDELCFMLGPILAAALCTGLSPYAGTLTGCVLLLTGMALFTAQRRTEPPPVRDDGAVHGRAPLRLPGVPPLLGTFLATGAVFGSVEVVTVAYADGQGHKSAAGAVLACQAAGSAAAGLAFGALRLRGSLERRLLCCAGSMAALMALPLLASVASVASAGGNLTVLAGALLIAGMATAPTMVTGMTLLQHRVPRARLNEGMTLAVTALLGGIAAGSAAGGWAVERVGAHGWAYAVPASAALLAALVTASANPRGDSGSSLMQRTVAPGESEGSLPYAPSESR
ncbi:MFS transporter [Streptomyces boncukensis]|uniref:MFS transporter n=1 Tax=Streptomyces boncukensis TaxID=2711219 RepID=A0A6G4WT89_9ACTN|nr:MFS transporter [Streptomyces boncukensis]NGO68499.1 MFS transporter [Streptomyces boncukensis]